MSRFIGQGFGERERGDRVGWEAPAAVVTVVGPLVGVPMGLAALYLRGVREQQAAAARELGRRLDGVEAALRELTRCVGEFERQYATKEEWVRESMHARRRIDRLAEGLSRVCGEMEALRERAGGCGGEGGDGA